MSTEQRITISDADRNVDYVLDVKFDRLPAEPEVGYGGGIEVNSCKCVEVITWLDKRAVSGWPGREDEAGLETKMGEWCRDKYPSEIEAAISELNEALVDA